MKLSQKKQEICDKFRARDDKGHVHCFECPLRIGTDQYDFRCQANSHFNAQRHEWEYDE